MDGKRILNIKKRISKLQNLEKELDNFDGYAISITKLTVIKYLCQDSSAMIKFAYFVSQKVNNQINYTENDISLKEPIAEILELMKRIINNFTKTEAVIIEKTTLNKIGILNQKIKDYQNKIESKKWTDIRIINNWDIFIIEEAISCFMYSDFPEIGYKLAKSYAEKYNASFGSGLIPESLEYLKEINYYWIDYLNKIEDKTINIPLTKPIRNAGLVVN
ncbi:MAG: hypothetical protein JKY53_02185 [Flavobacteriales bacterium]|nr:hypothetical protein [Flavobacteriales bacterium]